MKLKANGLDTAGSNEDARSLLAAQLEARDVWLLREEHVRGGRVGASVELRRGEWELRAARGALLLSFWGDAGARTWRVAAWRREGEKLLLEATRRAGAERARLELVPRASLIDAKLAVAEARRAACASLAALIQAEHVSSKVEEARLSAGARRGEPGRYARILLRDGRALIAATGPVVELGPQESDAFLASALLWYARLSESVAATRGPRELWLLVPPRLSVPLAERLPLLREDLRDKLYLYEVDAEAGRSTRTRPRALNESPEDAAPRLARATASEEGSELAARIVALAPESIDVVRALRGETLRYHGLAFARVRRVAGREGLWFGAGRWARRCLLDEGNWPELLKLLEELDAHRRADAAERRHAFYTTAPEAWLESLLRRDISRLDPGLRLAPLHAQFRATRGTTGASRPVDLLALRRDGRLVVIELKVSEDVALPLQGADYWRRIFIHHRAGHITGARLFGEAEISGDPPLVYLVAPLLRFHRAFQSLARCVSPEIEIYRFDINEDWRAGVRVARRARVN